MSRPDGPDRTHPAPPARKEDEARPETGRPGEELSDEELEDVAGGTDSGTTWAPPPPPPLPPLPPVPPITL